MPSGSSCASFDAKGRREVERITLPGIYRRDLARLSAPESTPVRFTAIAVHGPYAPEQGHRFNPNKLLLDPYARELIGDVKWSPAQFGYKPTRKDEGPLVQRARQRAGHAEMPR